MKVDTLLFSGCSTKGHAMIGSLMTLVNKNIIDLENINTYICCSGGAIIGLLLSCGYSLAFTYRLSFEIDYKKLLNIEDLNKLFDKCGLFDNKVLEELVEKLLYNKFKIKNITLKKLNELTNKIFIAKVYNLTDKTSVYISYENYPNLCVSQLIKITTCIPILFKPILYEKKYYLDGGLTGNMVYSQDHKNYMGIYITTKCNCNIENLNIIQYIQLLTYSLFEKYNFNVNDNPKIINLSDIFNESCFDFNIKEEQKEYFRKKSIDATLLHIYKYKL